MTAAKSEELVTLVQAAQELDVHYMTAYRYVRTGRMFAEKSGGKWWVTPDALAAVLEEGTGRRTVQTADQAPRELLVAPFVARLIAGDATGCWNIITAALSGGATPSDIYAQFLRPAMQEVGQRWKAGELSVAVEHRATATAIRLIGQMGPLFRRPGRHRGTIVLGMVAGDPHSLPTAMLADLLTDRHFDVIDLGANTPTESFIEMCQAVDDLVGLGLCVADTHYVDAAVGQTHELRAALTDVFMIIGGGALDHGGSAAFAEVVDRVSTSADHACDLFEQATSEKPSGA